MAYIEVVSTSETSISVQMNGMDTNYGDDARVCTWYLNGVYKGQSRLYAHTSYGGLFSFSGLSPGTSYSIRASVKAPNWENAIDFYLTASTENRSVSYWSWTSSNGGATAAQTQSAYTAVTGNGKTTDFSYLVWNDMVDKVKSVLDAKGFYWNSTYASYDATKMSYSDRAMTATRFNSLQYNIGLHFPHPINAVSKGDTVYGWYFTTLTEYINKWIG